MKKNNFKSLMQAAVLICTPLVIASCDDVFGDVDNPIPSYLTVSQAAVNLELHAAHPEKATFIRKANAATGAEVVYSSSDEKIATVDAAGKITAVNGGSCWIRVKATGMDSHGKMTYQEAIDSFKVNVQDWRAQIKFAEESAVVNSALIKLGEFKLKDSEVYPATGCTVEYTHKAATGSTDPIQAKGGIDDDGNITLIKDEGKAVITATISKVPDGYEMESFGDGKKVEAEFTLEVKEGVAYIAGYDATGKEIRKYILKGEGAEEYTNLAALLNGGSATTDVTLDAGWYYLEGNAAGLTKNIRVKGDVNIILNSVASLTSTSNDIMDESAKQNYKLNFYPQKRAALTPATGSATFRNIKDFKEVNICGVDINAPVNAVENVTINKGSVGALTGIGTGTVSIIDGKAAFGGTATDIIQKFATLTLAKVVETPALPAYAPQVGALKTIGTVVLGEGSNAGNLTGITNLTIGKASSVGTIGAAGAANKVETLAINEATTIGNLTNIGTANITKSPIKILSNVTNLTLNEISTTGTAELNKIGAVTINKTKGTATFNKPIIANALNIVAGTITVNNAIKGFDTNGDADTKVTMTGGKLTVSGPGGAVFAVLGDVNVSGELATGDFEAVSPDHHGVSGTLVGTFEGSTDGKTWTAITGAERPKYIRNKKAE